MTTTGTGTGRVKHVNAQNGWGVIRRNSRECDLFFRKEALEGGLVFGPQLQGERVSFDFAESADGKFHATSVRPDRLLW